MRVGRFEASRRERDELRKAPASSVGKSIVGKAARVCEMSSEERGHVMQASRKAEVRAGGGPL